MSYATLMVHVHAEGRLSGRVAIAAALAGRFRAYLIGIAAWAPVTLFLSDRPPAEPPPMQSHLQDMMSLLELKGREFCAAVENEGRRAEWRAFLELPTDVVAREARATDLIIIGATRESDNPFLSLDPGSVLLKAGRPVLVVPPTVTALVPKRIAIAWKDIREARHAIQDALPFLHQAESVMIVEVCDEDTGAQAWHRINDVAGYLNRHGIDPVAKQVRSGEGEVARSLLDLVREENVDLIVAGAYGRSRLGEWAYGGATRGFLTESPVCCLFAH